MEFPISIISTYLPQDDLVNMTDFCVYHGKKYLLCAFENKITGYYTFHLFKNILSKLKEKTEHT